MGGTSSLGECTMTHILTSTLIVIRSVLLTLTTTFLGLKGFLWTLVFTYTFLANGFFLVSSSQASNNHTH